MKKCWWKQQKMETPAINQGVALGLKKIINETLPAYDIGAFIEDVSIRDTGIIFHLNTIPVSSEFDRWNKTIEHLFYGSSLVVWVNQGNTVKDSAYIKTDLRSLYCNVHVGILDRIQLWLSFGFFLWSLRNLWWHLTSFA